MATQYEAVVRAEVLGLAAEHTDDVMERLRARVPRLRSVERLADADDGAARLEIHLTVDANDASQVQLHAWELCQRALDQALIDIGLGVRSRPMDDVSVRASS